MTPQPQTIILQGLDIAQHFDLLKRAVREVMEEMTAAAGIPDDATLELPAEVPAALAAKYCGYATGKSLAQYHHDGLTPLRQKGRKLFYARAEVLALKKRLFNR